MRSSASSSSSAEPLAFGFKPRYLALLLTPPNLVSSYFELSVEHQLFLSRPTHCADGSSLTSFTVALVMDAAGAKQVPWVLPAFRRVLDRTVAALAHEQERTQFVLNELELIARIKAEGADRGWSPPFTTQRLIDVSELALVLSLVYDHFEQVSVGVLRASTFGWWRTLRQPLNIRLNSWLELNLALSLDPNDGAPPAVLAPPAVAATTMSAASLSPASQQAATASPYPVASLADCRPWHALLLLDSGTSIVVRLPPDASPSLRALLLAASPLVSFEDLMVELGIPLVTLYKLALHVQHWGWARITATVSESSLFCRNWDTTLDLGKVGASSELASLCLQLLAPFDEPRRVRDVERIDDVLWLLKYDLIVQVCTYFYLVVPEVDRYPDPLASPADPDPPPPLSTSSASPRSVAAKKRHASRAAAALTPAERAFIDSLDPSPARDLLLRLFKYFRGSHCIEEIMWRENLSRALILDVASRFDDFIVVRTTPHK
ncbi:uncharacterized protein AMSG_05935 [Thecamonas trahens ATCC 50062]|uniref:GATOR1 complex protein NPRL3 C-terminal HTH domain-containing protein n=1 Tax=Thecamonas trahens ATCC 50062 TaxID=461836 RepID=A0A0L0DEC3_THETB|nr:hypothetical protein AMSG_05935 [Thecamonas trahens ATCC 50062]KNC49673.1 hypothetical protein AMSG_05935 [Thecamonas trahens ATCC 50062]|eukprot:XP_013757470.1 hypothetical protein AMSG_05935 [Thecamonas trahens ATCC 50062]